MGRVPKSKKVGQKKEKNEGKPTKQKSKAKGDGQTLNGLHRRTGVRNRCYTCDSKYPLAPECPLKDAPRGRSLLHFLCPCAKIPRLPYSPISMESKARVQDDGSCVQAEGKSNREQTSIRSPNRRKEAG